MDIKTIISIAGGPTAVAALFGINSQAVSQWKRVPVDRCRALEDATNGAVTRFDMRPDVFGAPGKQELAVRHRTTAAAGETAKAAQAVLTSEKKRAA